MPSVFVSYAREDLKRITRLLEGLSNNGVSVWRDEDNLRGGQNWPEALGEAIRESQFFLLAWSKQAADSEPVKNEWNTAIALNKTIIPCLLDDTPVPHSLAAKHWINGKDLDKAIIAITKSVQGKDIRDDTGSHRRVLPTWRIVVGLLVAVAVIVIAATAYWEGRYQSLAGYVVDKSTGKPLEGVVVSIPEYGVKQLTDQDGYFRFDKLQAAREQSVTFTVRKKGYEEKTADATLPNTDLRPSLQRIETSQ